MVMHHKLVGCSLGNRMEILAGHPQAMQDSPLHYLRLVGQWIVFADLFKCGGKKSDHN